MNTTFNQQSSIHQPVGGNAVLKPSFPPISSETRSHIGTDEAAHHLNRKSQTLRIWACLENGPLRPIRINGRLAWPVNEIKALLQIA